MDSRRVRHCVWREWFDSGVAAPPPLDIAAVIAYCEQRVPPHALYTVHLPRTPNTDAAAEVAGL